MTMPRIDPKQKLKNDKLYKYLPFKIKQVINSICTGTLALQHNSKRFIVFEEFLTTDFPYQTAPVNLTEIDEIEPQDLFLQYDNEQLLQKMANIIATEFDMDESASLNCGVITLYLAFKQLKIYRLNAHHKHTYFVIAKRLTFLGERKNPSIDAWYQVVGTKYQATFKRDFKKLKVGNQLKLVRERTNKYDKFAIRVVNAKNSHTLGYISRQKNTDLANFMDEGGKVKAYVANKKDDSEAYNALGVTVKIRPQK
ncbi:MAG: HIRAN domain-containing protein [Lactobacillaceae bacterium]|jgi:hypothetical protein|nr:HIRAN domain-containing protein [Lactobacillaceae bacterium]